MGFFATLAVGFLTAIVGGLGAGCLAAVCVAWYHITSREGASGYFVVFMGLLGIVAGFLIGVVSTRFVAARPAPSFGKALGVSTGAAVAILLLVLAGAFLGADFPPKIDGKELIVEIEVRLPEGMSPPKPDEVSGLAWSAAITADHGSRSQRMGQMEAAKARQEEGRFIVPVSIYLHTSDPGKSLGIVLGDGFATQFFDLPIGARPTRADMEWSGWKTDAHLGNLTPVAANQAASIRYRVQFYVEPPPPPPQPTEEETEARKKAEEEARWKALTPDSAIDDWLPFARYGQPEERRKEAANAMARRTNGVAELSQVIRGDDRDRADVALRAVALMSDPPASLAPAVTDVGKSIADDIRVVNATSAEEDPSYMKAANVEVRFMGWKEAARALHGRSGVDMRPVLKAILDLARVRTESYTMREVARVGDFYLAEWEKAK